MVRNLLWGMQEHRLRQALGILGVSSAESERLTLLHSVSVCPDTRLPVPSVVAWSVSNLFLYHTHHSIHVDHRCIALFFFWGGRPSWLSVSHGVTHKTREKKSPSWNTGHASDRRPATCCLFFFSWFLGAIFALTVCWMIFLLGCVFPRANAELRYIQSEMPSTLQPQSLIWLLPMLRGLVVCRRLLLICGVALQGSMLRVKQEKTSFSSCVWSWICNLSTL